MGKINFYFTRRVSMCLLLVMSYDFDKLNETKRHGVQFFGQLKIMSVKELMNNEEDKPQFDSYLKCVLFTYFFIICLSSYNYFDLPHCRKNGYVVGIPKECGVGAGEKHEGEVGAHNQRSDLIDVFTRVSKKRKKTQDSHDIQDMPTFVVKPSPPSPKAKKHKVELGKVSINLETIVSINLVRDKFFPKVIWRAPPIVYLLHCLQETNMSFPYGLMI